MHMEQRLRLEHNVDLSDHSTMRVGGLATYFAKVHSVAEVQYAYEWADAENIPVCTIGSGSNIIWADAGYPGLVLQNQIQGFHTVSQNSKSVKLYVGAGEILDDVVKRTVENGFTGIECLSSIPGSCGGAIIQNSGAYGTEISEVLQHVDVYDTYGRQIATLDRDACELAYRSSRFKDRETDRFVILGMTLHLQRGPPVKTFYPALQDALAAVKSPTSADVRSAVIAIRKKKLPDPALIPNCGSFFTNPVISDEATIEALHSARAPLHTIESGGCKVPAAWLIEQCGLKDHVDEQLGYGTWVEQPLMLFAKRRSSCNALLDYSSMIQRAVKVRFGITMEREPILLGGCGLGSKHCRGYDKDFQGLQ